MKLVELFCAILCFSLFVNVAGSTATSLAKNYFYAEVVRHETERDIFIAESFRRTCHGRGFYDLREWQRVCSAMFDMPELSYGVYKNGEALPSENHLASESNFSIEQDAFAGGSGRNLLYCSWESSRGKITVIDFVRFD